MKDPSDWRYLAINLRCFIFSATLWLIKIFNRRGAKGIEQKKAIALLPFRNYSCYTVTNIKPPHTSSEIAQMK
ncbi:hypothetical protein GS682_25105 [Nostoc sp. B(2019)]|nr:hypothetical protein [Nostoc sp. B(2019)]